MKAGIYGYLIVLMLILAGNSTAAEKFQFVKGDQKIDVKIAGELFTSYLYGKNLLFERGGKQQNLGKPVLFPINTPSGIMICRNYPLVQVEGETRDHPHHSGIAFSHANVNGHNFWSLNKKGDQIKHKKITKMESGEDKGTLSVLLHWQTGDGKVLLQEKRDMVFSAGETIIYPGTRSQVNKKQYFIDYTMVLTAQDEKVVFTDSKEGSFGFRAADWMNEYIKNDWAGNQRLGTGRYHSSQGRETQLEVWGRRARWMKLDGNKDGYAVGVAFLNHPDCVNYPVHWMTRGYGPFGASPFGQYIFESTRWEPEKNPQHFDFTLQPGKSVVLRFGILVYDGLRTPNQIEKLFKEYIK